jgi:hypothetical protein
MVPYAQAAREMPEIGRRECSAVAGKKNGADREIDLHGYTSGEARARLNTLWSSREWHGLQRVRVIHGTGSVLHALVRLWCEEKGITWTVEPSNTGVTIVHPGRRLQTDPAPPHRPLRALKPHRPAAKRRDSEAAARDPDDGLTDEERMRRAFDQLGVQEMGSLLKEKRSSAPGPHIPPPPGAGPKPPAAPESSPALTPTDPMEEEFARLGQDDALTLFKRKRELLPPREAPKSAAKDRVAPHLPALAPEPEADLMAQEFARLGEEAPQATRQRKRE